MSVHYFAVDGNYGDASLMCVMDTSDWTEADWQRIEEASDSDRPEVAFLIKQYTNREGKNNGR